MCGLLTRKKGWGVIFKWLVGICFDQARTELLLVTAGFLFAHHFWHDGRKIFSRSHQRKFYLGSIKARQSPLKMTSLFFFMFADRPPTFKNPTIASVDKRQLVKIRSSSSDGQTPESRWSLLPSRAHFQVELVLDQPGEGPPNLRSVPRALARPFPPSLLITQDRQRQCFYKIWSFVSEMAVCQSHLTDSFSKLCRMRNPSTAHGVATHCC